MPLRMYTGTDNEDGDDVGDDSEEKMLRTQTVDDFLVLLEKPKLPQVLAQVRTALTLSAIRIVETVFTVVQFIYLSYLSCYYTSFWRKS